MRWGIGVVARCAAAAAVARCARGRGRAVRASMPPRGRLAGVARACANGATALGTSMSWMAMTPPSTTTTTTAVFRGRWWRASARPGLGWNASSSSSSSSGEMTANEIMDALWADAHPKYLQSDVGDSFCEDVDLADENERRRDATAIASSSSSSSLSPSSSAPPIPGPNFSPVSKSSKSPNTSSSSSPASALGCASLRDFAASQSPVTKRLRNDGSSRSNPERTSLINLLRSKESRASTLESDSSCFLNKSSDSESDPELSLSSPTPSFVVSS
mmetsp:Transcript_2863/g.9435  ORF Transcript_2863/g.9435 Transcript_2863/m.9435 type:complete len:274 (+) Transcript_2863:91-912(+)